SKQRFAFNGAKSYRSRDDLEDKRRIGYIYALFYQEGGFLNTRLLPKFFRLSQIQNLSKTKEDHSCHNLTFTSQKQRYCTEVKNRIRQQDHVRFLSIKQHHMFSATPNMHKIYSV